MRADFFHGRTFFLAAAVLLWLGQPLEAARTLLSRESFRGVGTLNAAAPGGLGTVVEGAFFKRPGGPRLSGDTSAAGYGWSADPHSSSRAYHLFASLTGTGGGGSPTPGMICGWYYFASIGDDGMAGRQLELLTSYRPSGLNNLSIRVTRDFAVSLASDDGTVVNAAAPLTLTPNTWYWFALAWVPNGATDGDLRAYCKTVGGPLTLLGSVTGASNVWYDNNLLRGGFLGANIYANARYGAASYYRIGSFADVAYPPEIGEPASARRHWYVNPANGSDGNDGATAGTAWATADKITAESASLGLFPGTSYNTGDVLHLDCSGAPLAVGVTPIQIRTRGLSVLQTGGALDPMKTLAAGGWSPVSGKTRTYQSTDGGAADLLATVIFEDGKYLNHPAGANYAAVTAYLESTPGSFWTDGATLYLHPFGDTDPRADGKFYRRTRNRYRLSPGTGESVVFALAPDIWWDGLVCAGTTLVDPSGGGVFGTAYCFQWEQGSGGVNLLSNFSVDHFDKHAVGATIRGSGSSYTRQDGVYGQATPYGGFGGSTADVQFSDDPASSGIQWAFVRCRQDVNIGAIGSAAGRADPGVSFYTSHASGVAFGLGQFIDCRTPGYLDEQGCTEYIYLRGSSFGSVSVDCTLTAEQCRTTAGPITTAQGWLTLRNCLLKITTLTSGYQFGVLGGSLDVEGCTIDLRGSPQPGNLFTAVWGRAAGADSRNIYIRNTALLTDANKNLTLLLGFDPNGPDTLDLDDNLYQPGASGYVMGTAPFAPLTLAQWQAASGQDAHSRALADLGLGTDARPTGYGAAVIDAGVALGPLTDLDGVAMFPGRRTVGAYEFKPSFSLWQSSRFANPAQRGGPLADPDGNGLSNLLEYAFGLAPGATAADALAARPVPMPPAAASATGVTMTYRALQNSADLTYTPEVSADLKTWQSGAAYVTQTGVVDSGGGASAVTVRAAAPAAGAPPWRFMRLRVTLAGSN